VGDKLEAHELWQHANLRANRLATDRLSTIVSQDNPVIALDRTVHIKVNTAQRGIDAASQHPIENIRANAAILRRLGVAPEQTINELPQKAVQNVRRNGF